MLEGLAAGTTLQGTDTEKIYWKLIFNVQFLKSVNNPFWVEANKDNLSHLKCNNKLVKLVLTNNHTNPSDCKCFWYILNQLDVSYITTVFQLYQKNILFHWKVDEIITFCVSSSETVDGFGGQLARTDVFPSLKDMESAMQKAMKTT